MSNKKETNQKCDIWSFSDMWGLTHLRKITITAWAKDAFTSRNHVNHAPTPSGVSIYVAPLPSSPLVSSSFILWSRLPKLKEEKKALAALWMRPLPSHLPTWTQGPCVAFASHGEKMLRRQPEQHMVQWGNAGWRTIRLDALHLSLWIQTLSQFYSQRETFYSPSFE